MEKKRNRIINAILFVTLVLTIGIILYLTKSNFLKPKDVIVEEEKINDFKIFEVEELDSKLNKLSFSNKKQDFYNKKDNINVNVTISSGVVSVSIKIDKIKVSYKIEEIKDAICIHSNVYKNHHITYILTGSGKVYKIDDDLNEVKNTEYYNGKAIDLKIMNATSIAIDKNLKFKINKDLDNIVPCVYIKTNDNRIFTDEKIIDNENIVELIEKENAE